MGYWVSNPTAPSRVTLNALSNELAGATPKSCAAIPDKRDHYCTTSVTDYLLIQLLTFCIIKHLFCDTEDL